MSEIVILITQYVASFSHLLAIIVIVIGMMKASWGFAKDVFFNHRSRESLRETRMELGHSFSLGLGFLIGASILKTVVAPTWDDIGKLSAIIAIRTILNYFLLKDMRVPTKKETDEKDFSEKEEKTSS